LSGLISLEDQNKNELIRFVFGAQGEERH